MSISTVSYSMNTSALNLIEYLLSSTNNPRDQVTVYLWAKDFTFCLIDRFIDPNKNDQKLDVVYISN